MISGFSHPPLPVTGDALHSAPRARYARYAQDDDVTAFDVDSPPRAARSDKFVGIVRLEEL